MSFYLAASLIALRDEINARFPNRDKSSDGWIGDTAHSARKSDHNPDYSMGGVVRAIDIDITDNDPRADIVQMILKAVIGDPRVYYVIFNGKIYSRTYGFRARTYTGSNAHTQHIHVSILSTRTAERDTRRWLDAQKRPTKPMPLSIEIVKEQFRRVFAGQKTRSEVAVRRLQRALNIRYGTHLTEDGIAGPATVDSWARHERAVGVKGNARLPDIKTLPSLLKGLYYIWDKPQGKAGK